MKKIQYFVFLLAACLLLTSCNPINPPKDGTTKDHTSSDVNAADPVPKMLSFDYGRLTLENRFVKMTGNGIDFTLNFDKKIITPGNDIVLTAYVTTTRAALWI